MISSSTLDHSVDQHFPGNRIPRRAFVRLTAVTGGLAVAGGLTRLTHADDAGSNTTGNLDRSYLEAGLNALARAHHMSSMAGHLGASMIAGYYLARQRPNLDPTVEAGIQDDLRRVRDGESVFGQRMSRKSKIADAELFEPFAKQTADATLIDGIAEGLQKSIDKPRQSGHNVIFASLAIRALQDHPEYATPAVVDGILKLTNLFQNQTPGSGYYGKAKGRLQGNKITLPEDDATPVYDNIEGMAGAVLDEVTAQDPSIHRSGYGGVVHLINHAAAINDLADAGYVELAVRAVGSHRQHLRLWRNLPNVANEKGPLQISKFTPHDAAYWTSGDVPYDRALLTHRVKTMYGFDELAAAIEAEEKENAATTNSATSCDASTRPTSQRNFRTSAYPSQTSICESRQLTKTVASSVLSLPAKRAD